MSQLNDPYLNPASLAELMLDPPAELLGRWLHRIHGHLGRLCENRELNRALGLGDAFRACVEEHIYCSARPDIQMLLILAYLICHATFTQVHLDACERHFLDGVNHDLGTYLLGMDRDGELFDAAKAAAGLCKLHDAAPVGFVQRQCERYLLSCGASSSLPSARRETTPGPR